MWLVLLEELKTTTEPLSTVGEEEGGSILFEVASPVHILWRTTAYIFLHLNFIGEEEGGFEVASPVHIL